MGIDEAFTAVDRVNFVPPEWKHLAYADTAIPIGYGQTISQPTTVELMLRWLDPQPGDKVLDVGSGSGWTAALLASIVGPKGEIYAVERIPELLELGRENVERLGVRNVRFFRAGDAFGLPEYAPYDRILVSAAADKMPEELIRQLKPGGRLVIPVRENIYEVRKTDDGKVDIKEHPEFLFVFVPLI